MCLLIFLVLYKIDINQEIKQTFVGGRKYRYINIPGTSTIQFSVLGSLQSFNTSPDTGALRLQYSTVQSGTVHNNVIKLTTAVQCSTVCTLLYSVQCTVFLFCLLHPYQSHPCTAELSRPELEPRQWEKLSQNHQKFKLLPIYLCRAAYQLRAKKFTAWHIFNIC